MTTLRDAPGAPASWPFAPIEELDLYLENAQEPSVVQLETHTRGHLDRAALEAALAGVLAADPPARRHLAATSRWSRRLHWEAVAPAVRTDRRPVPGGTVSRLDGGLLTVTRWSNPGQLAALREQLSAWPMSLNEGAARVILAVGSEHDAVILQTHHAAFDGISSLALLSAICAAYRDSAGASIRSQATSPARPGLVQPPAPHRALRGQAAVARRGGSRPGRPGGPGYPAR